MKSKGRRRMNLNDMAGKICGWLKGNGPSSEFIISSRVRLARNLEGIPFTHQATTAQKKEVDSLIARSAADCKFLKNYLHVNLQSAKPIDKKLLVERHIISDDLAKASGPRAVLVEDTETISIMVNEEDHLRLQTIEPGQQLMDTWRLADAVETELGRKLDFSFSPRWGYLTACPTNTGTGMRASVMMHLPALVLTRRIGAILEAIAKLGLVIRGLYGEGTEPAGNFFQISNQVTLGQSEEEIISNIELVTKQIIDNEKNACSSLLEKGGKVKLADKIFRAYGTLKNARLITSGETLALLSMLRLGVDLGLIKEVDRRLLNELFLLTQPAHIQKVAETPLSAGEQDIKRAELIRKKLR